jgi:hypothetical protein
MLQFSDVLPSITIDEREYKRLLGLPQDHVLEGRMEILASWARAWYSTSGHPWFHARQAATVKLIENGVELDGIPMRSPRLRQIFSDAEAHGAMYVAAGAGPEPETEASRLWKEEKPDEYFFLECYGSAVVEHLTTLVGARLCEWADKQGMAVLPHVSPGYQGWDIRDQHNLFDLLQGGSRAEFPGGLEVMDSGMLRPKKSLLAVFGLTRRIDLTQNLAELVPCSRCSFAPCDFRRAPYHLGKHSLDVSPSEPDGATATETIAKPSPLRNDPQYGFSKKALKLWGKDRMELKTECDGTIRACFHLEGSTCSNMGHPLAFDYHMHLAAEENEYRILDTACVVDKKVSGYRAMCSYIEDHRGIMESIKGEKPLDGELLDAVIDWDPDSVASGCLCGPADRNHKWRIVLQTLHFALKQLEKS